MATIDEDKLKKLLTDIVTEISYTVMPAYHTDLLFASLKDKIEKADLTKKDISVDDEGI